MKRNLEITFVIIGGALSLFGVFLMVTFKNALKQPDIVKDIVAQLNKELAEQNIYYSVEEFGQSMNSISTIILTTALLSVIVAIVASLLFKNNKYPFAASLILVISGVLILLGSFFTGFLTAIFYVIAGIMGFVRKPPIEDTYYPSEFSSDSNE